MPYIKFNNASQPAINDTNLNKMQDLIHQDVTGAVSGDTLPIGAIVPFGSDTIPENWLLCNGQAISRTEYVDLFNNIGTTFGIGDGFTTFNLPNLSGKVTVGKNESDSDFSELGKTGGEKEHTLTVDEIPSNKHSLHTNINATGFGTNNSLVRGIGGTNEWKDNEYYIESTGGDKAHNNLQPYIVSNFIIKAKQSAGIVATVVNSLESESETDALSAKQGKILKKNFSKNILWKLTDSSTISNFPAQTIQLESDDYDYLIIFYYRSPSSRSETKSAIVEKNTTIELQYCDFFNNAARAWSRTAQASENTVIFSDATIDDGIQNHTLIPYKIMGCNY